MIDAAARSSDSKTVGDYLLIRRLGSGSMGEVWLGRHQVTEAFAAVKLLRENVRSRDRIMKTFDRERRAISRLSHPHIVSLYDVGPAWLATAYIDGTDLARRLKTPIDPATAVYFTLQVASALAHAHAHGVVHRDVKPSNILIDTTANAFLADFGLAQLPEELGEAGPENRVGTPAFMAPEQMRGEVAGPAADQYALGRTLMEMLVGGTLPTASKQALAELPAELPGALRETLGRATQPAVNDRFPSVSEFAASLASVDLQKYPPPRRLAPEVRVRTAFGWAPGASATEMLAPHLQRATFRLGELEAARLLRPEVCTQLREQTGYADVAWNVFGNTGRLGRLNDSSAYARATEVVVLLHGLCCSRRVWDATAASICRDHAQAVVIAPDLHGFGESPFQPGVYDERVGPVGFQRLLDGWLSILGLRELPTVLVGHSMGATGILSMSDQDLGERTSRVAITPVFPSVDDAYRRKLRFAASLVNSLGRATPFKSLFASVISNAAGEYTDADRRMMAEEFKKTAPAVFAALLRCYSDVRPPTGDKLQRCLVVIAEDDPVAPPQQVARALEVLGIPRTHVRRLTGSGHFPQGAQKDNPGWTHRNVSDLVNCIGSMLRASSEGTPMPTEVASTMMGSTEPPRAS